MQYVGELCRYLVATPPTQYDKAHACIVANGNGLQKDIWTQFMNKFHIPEIREIYRSTEGIAKFDNFKGGAASTGKVGFSGPLKRFLETNTYLVKYDAEREDLYRNPKTGFCVLAALDEPGEAIGRVQSMSLYPQYYDDPKATELKLVRDVFRKGDLFQRTGDLLIQDRAGWVRFHDRIGDTFRWKGENVSAGEVRAFISDIPNVQDVIVYGVKLDG
jgi:acyl-CoA synthetase (AMP-forming)/AMP-acid ligase II